MSGPLTLPDGTWSGGMDPDSSVDECAAQACYGCYCKNMDEQPFCQKYNEDEQEKLKLTAAIIAVSVCTNVVLKVLITQVTKFEGCHTSTEEEISTAIKIFVALLINAAVLPICLYADLSEFSWIPFVFDGVYSDVTGEWHANVGYPFSQAALINAFSFPFPSMSEPLLWHMQRWALKSRMRTHLQLEKLYTPVKFLLSERCGQFLTVIFYTIMFSSSTPMLYVCMIIYLHPAVLLRPCFAATPLRHASAVHGQACAPGC